MNSLKGILVQARVVLKYFAFGPAICKSSDNEFYRKAGTLYYRLTSQDRRVSNDVFFPVH